MTPIYDKHIDEENAFFLQCGCMCALPHYHHAVEIIYMPPQRHAVSKHAELTVNGITHKLDGELIALIDSDTVHALDSYAPDCYCAILPEQFLCKWREVKNNRVLQSNFITDREQVRKAASLLLALPDLFSDEYAFSAAVDLLLALLSSQLGFAHKKNHQLAISILTYIRTHCTENITLSSLAQKMGYHKCYLSQLINRYFGENFSHLVNTQRYLLFCKLQEQNDDILSNIYNAGFNSTSTFYRFCQQAGLQNAPPPRIQHIVTTPPPSAAPDET